MSACEKGEVFLWKMPIFVLMTAGLLLMQFVAGFFFIPLACRLVYSRETGLDFSPLGLFLWGVFALVWLLSLIGAGRLFFRRASKVNCPVYSDIKPVFHEDAGKEDVETMASVSEDGTAFFSCVKEVKEMRRKTRVHYYRIAGISILICILLLVCGVGEIAFILSVGGGMLAMLWVSMRSMYGVRIKGLHCPSCGRGVRFCDLHSVAERKLFICSHCGKSAGSDLPMGEKEYM